MSTKIRQLSIKATQEKMRQRCMSGGGGGGLGRFAGDRPEKTNSPTFAYQTVYGKDPSGFLPGRSGSPMKTWRGIQVDKGLKNEWLNRLNSLSVDIRSTEEGKGSVRPAAVVFRLPEKHDKLHKKIVRDLRKRPGLYAKSDVGMAGRPRICVAGKIWKGKKDWEKWWKKLPGEIENSYQRVIEKTATETVVCSSFIDELTKIGDAPVRTMTREDITTFGLDKKSVRAKFDKGWEHKIMVDPGGGVMGYSSYDPKKKELHKLWVAKRHRRKGVATTLVKSHSGPVEWFNVKPGNKVAKKFYKTIGMPELTKVSGYGAGPPPSTMMPTKKLPTVRRPTDYYIKKIAAEMPFPGRYRPALLRGSKNSTVRTGAEMGKYQPGMTYNATSYKGQPYGVQIKVSTVRKMPLTALDSVTRVGTANMVSRNHGLTSGAQVEVIKFEVKRG